MQNQCKIPRLFLWTITAVWIVWQIIVLETGDSAGAKWLHSQPFRTPDQDAAYISGVVSLATVAALRCGIAFLLALAIDRLIPIVWPYLMSVRAEINQSH